LVAVLAGAVGGLVASGVLGGPAGLGVGAVLAVGVFRWLRGLESATARRRRELIGLDLPWAADLLAAAVEGGAGLDAALRAVADAVGGPLAAELRTVCAALALGASPASAWVGVDPAVGVVGRSFVRAADQGTPPVEHLDRLAADLRARAAAESSVAQRAAGVRALAPLGACFLPAFLLLAVLPMVAGVATTILR
jgi:Flp pilus assembly protein TadB